MIHKHLDAAFQFKSDRRATTFLTVEELDRDSELTLVDGIDLRDFARNPIAFKNHRYSDGSIGQWVDVERTTVNHGTPALRATLVGPPPGASAYADAAWSELHSGLLPGTSIGFKSLEQGPPRLPGQRGVTHIRSLLLEASAVYLPSCPQCLIEKSCGCGGGTVCACRSTVRILTSEQVTQRNLVMQAAITRARVPTIAPLPPLQAQQHDSALKGWLGLKSDQHPSMYCPKGRECPSKAAQLATCPATDCPLQRNAAETMFDIDLDDTHHRSILTAAAKDIARDAGVQLAREVSHDLGQEMRRVLQHHRMMTTGRID